MKEKTEKYEDKSIFEKKNKNILSQIEKHLGGVIHWIQFCFRQVLPTQKL